MTKGNDKSVNASFLFYAAPIDLTSYENDEFRKFMDEEKKRKKPPVVRASARPNLLDRYQSEFSS